MQIWPRKRDLIKQCEVGLPVQLREAGLMLESLYTHNANGNVLHYDWKLLIEQRGFPFLKVSLLRDNPTSNLSKPGQRSSASATPSWRPAFDANCGQNQGCSGCCNGFAVD